MSMEILAGIWQQITWVASAASGPQGFVIALVTYVGMILFERSVYLFQHRHDWPERDSIANVVNNSVTALLEAVLAAIVGGALFILAYQFIYEHFRLFSIPSSWWGWALALLLNDLAYYTDHRIAHRTGLFWALHIPHHSSQEMNLTVSARGSITSLGGFLQPAYFLIPLLGLPLNMFLAAKFFGNLWGIFNHTKLVHRMGWLENWLATPANHRVHHGTQPKYLDRNYGQTLIVWDRLFGSFKKEEEEPIYGLVSQMNSHRIWDIQTWGIRWLIGQIRLAPRWSDKLRYLWKPPGWRHDGRHERTEDLQQQGGLQPAE
jgi:sterol desaturase/sphingolipid hydroxylase (fatty acid hydroxylase superfamily)